MKIATFTDGDGQRLGVVTDDGLVDLARAAPDLPREMIDFLQAGGAALDAARAAAAKAEARIPLSEVTLNAPIPLPGKILAIGLNYGEHIAETGREPPEVQIWFNKQHNCANDPFAPINKPAVSDAIDYEAELCFVIGKRCKHVPKERAHEVIGGYFCGNDVSVRDWQRRSPTMQMGKSFDTHGPMGPWLVTPDEVGDPHDLDIKCWVNNELRQNSNTRHMIFDCFDQIAHLSTAFTLDVGDVIFTGTPDGVGVAKSPPAFLKVGDKVRIEIEKIGAIEHEVVLERAETVIE
jgi:2-keto-4-pentenoate hydratase/2-oxohepta-3-ene-1,7-dioic acid hydratase in catechol pathway